MKPLLCLAFIILTTSALLIVWRDLREPNLPNGATYPGGADYYALNDVVQDPDTGRYHYVVYLPEEQAEILTLVLTRAKDFTLYADGEPYLSFSAQDYRRLRVIPVAPPLYDAGTGELRLEWSANRWSFSEGYGLFLGDTTALTRMISGFSDMQTVCMGILLLMLLHALSLLLSKRNERYLLIYSLYLTSILLALLLNSGFSERIGLTVTFPYFFIVAFLVALQKCISILMCCRLLNITLTGVVRRLFSPVGIILFCVLYCILYNVLRTDASAYFAEGVRLLFMLAGAYILIRGCADKKPYAWMLLVGYSVSMTMIITASLVNIGVIKDWLIFVQLRTGRIDELPFAFACMFCINRRFADKFKESERLAEELTSLNRSLDEKVAERTQAYVTERQQRHSMMLNIFHDLRSPLFILKGCTDILISELPSEHDMIGVMQERLSFLSGLIEDLFLLAKLEDDEIPFDCKCISLTDILHKIANAQRVAARKKNIRFSLDARPPCFVWGNAERLERALENLAVNAIHYTPEGGSIRMTLTVTGDTALVDVEDSGKGIPPEELDKIFVKYYTTDSRSHDSSTGLGLSISRSIIERHLGDISVTSALGRGSTFTVRLPILKPDEKEENNDNE